MAAVWLSQAVYTRSITVRPRQLLTAGPHDKTDAGSPLRAVESKKERGEGPSRMNLSNASRAATRPGRVLLIWSIFLAPPAVALHPANGRRTNAELTCEATDCLCGRGSDQIDLGPRQLRRRMRFATGVILFFHRTSQEK